MTSTTTRRLRLDRAQLARALNGDPEVVRQFELLLSMVNAIESGGGSGGVTSVNGETGVVVLGAADVGADVAGAAAVVDAALSAHEALTVGAHGISELAVGGLTAATIDVPFGRHERTVTIADANCTATSKVLVGWGATLPTDENQPSMGHVDFSAVPAAGSLDVTVSSDEPVGGAYKILYTLG